MALYLEGKTSVDTNELSPKEATQMSHQVKFLGMDVHKEAIVIAASLASNRGGVQVVVSSSRQDDLRLFHLQNFERGASPLQIRIDGADGTVAARRPQALLSHAEDCLLQLIFGRGLGRQPLQIVCVP
jgi:hypothetical protein